MVPGGGIEPTTLSLEGFCSSTELPGQNTEKLSILLHPENSEKALFVNRKFP